MKLADLATGSDWIVWIVFVIFAVLSIVLLSMFVIVKFRRQIYGVLVLDQACFLLE